jgi:hypothetical protein
MEGYSGKTGEILFLSIKKQRRVMVNHLLKLLGAHGAYTRIRRCNPSSVSVFLLCIALSCRNPFFPPTGMPDKVPPLRSTPAGVIKQLIQAYESKDLNLFQDLFPPSKSFQFYVCPTFYVSSYSSRSYVNPPEPRDTRLQNIGEYSYYYYWVQDIEIQSHLKLFKNAESIEFKIKPDVNPGNFRYITNDTGDTVNVEVLMENGEIFIKIKTATYSDESTIAIEKQVFFLERDADNLWVIRKWYDFGSQP